MTDASLCWCCQEPFPEGEGSARDRVWIDPDTALPICRRCWNKIGAATQAELALRFRDRGPDGMAVHDVLGLLDQALRKSLDSPLDWLRGSEN